MARRGAAEVVTGAVVLAVAAGFLVFAVAHSGTAPSGGYPLHAEFNSVAGLPVGSDVRLAGVKIGRVVAETINPETYLAQVTFTVANAIRIPKDSSAAVVSEGLLGGNYLELQPGGDIAMLPPNGRITVTQSPVNLETLLGKFIFSMTNAASTAAKGVPSAPAMSKP
ncbi:MAG: outer membrane lipid asymmetry maintenance protein MlaD [Rhodospirillales bacterium]|nr:outer membrane lipid asymmetry maintenance protein MlaD [Rhodospirillales bacterium]